MGRWVFIVGALVVACESRSSPPPPPQAPSPTITDAGTDASSGNPADACLDEKLRAAHLNAFGDPEGTVYAGGSPLFDEATGRTLTRREYVARKHPELTASCPTSDAGAP